MGLLSGESRRLAHRLSREQPGLTQTDKEQSARSDGPAWIDQEGLLGPTAKIIKLQQFGNRFRQRRVLNDRQHRQVGGLAQHISDTNCDLHNIPFAQSVQRTAAQGRSEPRQR